MRTNKRQYGMTLTELLVVVAIMAVLLGISVPTAQHLKNSFESSTSVRHLINAALGNARAMAVRNQAYAGVRFQEDANGNTYMIFIIHDMEATGDAQGFRAVTGRKPMQLPKDTGVIVNVFPASNTNAENDALIDNSVKWTNASTFSVIFSPAGKLVVHPVRVRNKDGYNDGHTEISNDTIFNIASEVTSGSSMFYQDDYVGLGLDEEPSVQGFILFSKKELMAVPENTRWTDYFSKLKVDFISPYTGEIVMEYREQNP